MSSTIQTILVIGATSGIGRAFAQRFHAMGKKVIATGRREGRLNELKQACPGLETYVMDNSDLGGISGHVKTLMSTYPDVNAVWVNSGIQQAFDFKDTSAWPDEKLINEVNINTTAPIQIAKYFLPHLLSLKTEAVFMLTSSGFAFVPGSAYPVYAITKASIHHMACVLRDQTAGTNLSILELVPPYVETDLDLVHKEAAGGLPPMPLNEFTDAIFKILDGKKASEIKEFGVGLGDMASNAWRGAFQPIADQFGAKW
jgi:uncharacterized oxidoreductase